MIVKRDNKKDVTKTSITQRVWTDLRQSIGVTTAIKLENIWKCVKDMEDQQPTQAKRS